MASRVTAALEAQRHVFEKLGCIVEEVDPDLSGADEVFKVMRAYAFEIGRSEMLAQHRDKIKDTVIWNIEMGQKLSGPEIGRAEVPPVDQVVTAAQSAAGKVGNLVLLVAVARQMRFRRLVIHRFLPLVERPGLSL